MCRYLGIKTSIYRGMCLKSITKTIKNINLLKHNDE